MRAVDQHAEAHRLKNDLGYGARRIAQGLGVSRHAATQLLARPLPQPVAVPVAAGEPSVAEPEAVPGAEPAGVAEPVAELAGLVAEVADQRPPVAEGVVVPVGHVAGAVRFPLPGARSPWLRVDLSRRRGLLRDLRALARVGLQIPYVVEDVLRAFAAAYHQALATGHLQPGQGYEIHTRVRPCRHT
ncbi:hypothetical protein ACKI1O_34575 [Streptomyces scabiei]